MAIEKRFQCGIENINAEVVISVGPLRYTAVLFVDNTPFERQTGFRSRDPEWLGVNLIDTNVKLSGGGVSANVAITAHSLIYVKWTKTT